MGTLGDFNLDFSQKKFKNFIIEKCSLAQIIKKPTRVQTVNRSTGPTTSKTIIDHVYLRKTISQDCKYKILDLVVPELPDIKISDHKLVHVTYNIPHKPVSLYIQGNLIQTVDTYLEVVSIGPKFNVISILKCS